jgi:molybdate transport system substrate-binding protein
MPRRIWFAAAIVFASARLRRPAGGVPDVTGRAASVALCLCVLLFSLSSPPSAVGRIKLAGVIRTFLTILISLLAPQGLPAPTPITVSAAVSLTDALTAIAEQYGREGRGSVRFNFAASNVLARQIIAGAPVDLFVSADEAQMDAVAAAQLLLDGSRVDLLRNQLAIVVPNDRPRTMTGPRDLMDASLRRIAIGDPAAVPAGVYAKAWLEKEGLWPALEPRMVPSGSVRAALAAVESGAADAGIVYRTDARVALKATVAYVLPVDRGPRIVYPGAIVRASSAQSEAKRFLEYLRGATAARIFERFGFAPYR